MPVEFLSDDEAAAYGHYAGTPPQEELDRMFYLDDADRGLVARRRADHMRLGFALQLTTARYLGMFLQDPLDVPTVVLERLAGQLKIADTSCAKRYTERRTTPFDHREEIKAAHGLREFLDAEAEFARWARARAWNTGDGPKTIFNDGVQWLRANAVLLPGVTTLARIVARVRDGGHRRAVRDAGRAARCPPGGQAGAPGGAARGRAVLRPGALAQGTGESQRTEPGAGAEPGGRDRRRRIGALNIDTHVPRCRIVDLAGYGITARAQALRRHSTERRLATLVATVAYLEARSVDDCLELLDLLMATELLGKAEAAADKERPAATRR
jgi:uncharacterized protein DUF4158